MGVSSVCYRCYIDQTLCSSDQFAARPIYQLTSQEEEDEADSLCTSAGKVKRLFCRGLVFKLLWEFLVRVSPICVYDLVRVSL